MSGRLLVVSVSCVVLAIVAVTNAQSDESKGSSSTLVAQAATEAKAEPARKKARGRLPSHYGQLGISEKQRTQVYEIQAGYNAQITKLRDELKSIEQKRNTAVRAVLTPEQQKRFDELVVQAKQKREAARKKRAKKSAS